MSAETTPTGTPVDRLIMPRVGIYLVSRTSCCEGKPCDEAYEVEMMQVDRRNCDHPKKIPAHDGTDGDWYNHGSNHRVENGNICRDMGWRRQWVVQVNDVMDFVDSHGECVVGRTNEGYATIEIYNCSRF
jgi:hypothetical protein